MINIAETRKHTEIYSARRKIYLNYRPQHNL